MINKKQFSDIFKKFGVKDVRKAMTLLNKKIKESPKKMFAGTIIFKLCSDCRPIVMAQGLHNNKNNVDEPLELQRLCSNCQIIWNDNINKYKNE